MKHALILGSILVKSGCETQHGVTGGQYYFFFLLSIRGSDNTLHSDGRWSDWYWRSCTIWTVTIINQFWLCVINYAFVAHPVHIHLCSVLTWFSVHRSSFALVPASCSAPSPAPASASPHWSPLAASSAPPLYTQHNHLILRTAQMICYLRIQNRRCIFLSGDGEKVCLTLIVFLLPTEWWRCPHVTLFPLFSHRSIQHKYQLTHCTPPAVQVMNILVLKLAPFSQRNVNQNERVLSVAHPVGRVISGSVWRELWIVGGLRLWVKLSCSTHV